MQLKYEHIEIGQRIRAYDFLPRPECHDRYVEGKVVDHDYRVQGHFLVIEVTYDSMVLGRKGLDPNLAGRVGEKVWVPMETCDESMWQEICQMDRVQVIDEGFSPEMIKAHNIKV